MTFFMVTDVCHTIINTKTYERIPKRSDLDDQSRSLASNMQGLAWIIEAGLALFDTFAEEPRMMQRMVTHQPAALIILQFARTKVRVEEEPTRRNQLY